MKPLDACYYLENKAYFMPPAETKDQELPETPFTCLKTHEAFGPDGDLACEETCCEAHRACYKPEVEI